MVDTHQIAPGAGAHAVLFYQDEPDLVGTVGRYLGDAIRAGEGAMVVATEAHRRGIEAALLAAGIDLDEAVDAGAFVSLDAATTLKTFVAHGRVDENAFRRGLGKGLPTAARPIRFYGEMVSLLWSAGAVSAAIELETLWNRVGRDLPFTVLCGYEASAVSSAEHAEALQRVCQLHSSVHGRANDGPIHTRGRTAPAIGRSLSAERDSARGPLSLQISNAVGHLHKQFVGRGPTRVHTHIDGDLVVCVLEGGLTHAERAVRAHAGDACAMEMRARVQDAMRQAIAEAVESIVGRRVRSSMSSNDPAEDVQLEVMLLRPGDAGDVAGPARE